MRAMSDRSTSERKEGLTPDPMAYGCSHALSGQSYKVAARAVAFDVKQNACKNQAV